MNGVNELTRSSGLRSRCIVHFTKMVSSGISGEGRSRQEEGPAIAKVGGTRRVRSEWPRNPRKNLFLGEVYNPSRLNWGKQQKGGVAWGVSLRPQRSLR